MPVWGRGCVLCLNCVTTCPEEAVTCPLDWPVFRPFVRWNVNRAWSDAQLDHARVEFKRGRIKRV
jgi:ferredoxin